MSKDHIKKRGGGIFRAGGLAQEVELLPSKFQVLSSNSREKLMY
jgi:hypothetical protein